MFTTSGVPLPRSYTQLQRTAQSQAVQDYAGRELSTWTISAAYPSPTPLLGCGSWSKKLARYSSSRYLESCQACLKPHSVQVAPGTSPLHIHLFLPRDQPSC